MPVNALTTEAGLKVGPVLLDTLIKHYFDRHKTTTADGKPITRLRQDELMYDEVFNVVKIGQSFLRASSFHTVEDVQGFANMRTPSPPWVRVVRLVVPMSSCDDAAKHLIAALGGEEAARRVVGGVKWWQVRGIDGVDAQWITTKKDWQEAKRRREKAKETESSAHASTDSATYQKDMDEMRCILYSHGDLFLIRPPPGSAHCPVNPTHIVIAGDSAGGGLSLALLQVIRDSGLPMPAGGVLISPWCDLTHSFSSVHTNTATDVIPEWGLSLQKPSVLWPPPPDELSSRVHASLRSRIREVFRTDQTYDPTATMLSMAQAPASAGHPVDVGTTTSLPTSSSQSHSETVSLVARSGEILSTSNQLHLYTQNSLIPHPLVSPVLSYLGGLPPLLIIASDKEVLRDEIIHMWVYKLLMPPEYYANEAHKAANPDKFPIKDSTRALYPVLEGIEGRHNPTKVHLQVYDDAAHVLPVLFSFTTPAKFCFRAIATFCKHVTGIAPTPQSPLGSPPSSPIRESSHPLRSQSSFGTRNFMSKSRKESIESGDALGSQVPPPSTFTDSSMRKSLRRSLSASLCRATSARSSSRSRSEVGVQAATAESAPSLPHREQSTTSSDVGGPRFAAEVHTPLTPLNTEDATSLTAGDPRVYGELSGTPWDGTMMRERISTHGVIRALEPDDELGALGIDPDIIGRLSELTLRRYLEAQTKFDKKFSHTIRTIEKDRRHNLKLAKKDVARNMAVLHHALMREEDSPGPGTPKGLKEGLLASTGSWSWAWALDGQEGPPPSSIVSRRDTREARRLAKVADQALLQDDQALSGNRFWSAVVNFLTITPDRDKPKTEGIKILPSVTKRASRISRFIRKNSVTDNEKSAPQTSVG
ncbi:hypothetical protein DXG03_001430 [Asterophora parasitica]|uniref:Alpha/beta hydrolase fold-3 domain-containing protein n=1 Tax=Asterophora parasitica TaxID=117018 RepID=A0A9P7GCY3_9AGAR|nr:hypothetical protein DXG03_001430 [Asterophora parasitica]